MFPARLVQAPPAVLLSMIWIQGCGGSHAQASSGNAGGRTDAAFVPSDDSSSPGTANTGSPGMADAGPSCVPPTCPEAGLPGGPVDDDAGDASSPAPTDASASTLGPYTVQSYTLAQSLVPTGSAYCCDTKTAPMSPQASAPRAVPEIFYPANGRGNYPGIALIPGNDSDFASDPWTGTGADGVTSVLSNLPDWGRLLASNGFVVMLIDPVNYSAGPPERATALLQALSTLVSENTRSGSPLFNSLDTQNMAVMGHSYGGGGALIAASGGAGDNSRIKAALGLSPVTPSSLDTDKIPTGIICAQKDPYSSDQQYKSDYSSIPSTTSKFIAQFLFNTQLDTGHSIALNPLGSHTTDPYVARYGLSFFEVYLMHDLRYQQFLVTNSLMLDFTYHP
jgi:pimeloyl-ACP methyl ester carboxylesterase